ncbi:hypothetical protein BCV70DRAFT_232005 [Testicularia cyperi]|uniref:CRAL-TRIO domain-containing protein n=1 Tax=Testicularia cyperi TaxID=1882483 RepID=A0A317XQM7_9BASI|nr:hypothetical protein BCV70DRAFT_232005 [Testicularia cyperi]
MPSVQEAKSKDARAVQEKHLDLVQKFNNNYTAVEAFQKDARSQILNDVAEELHLNDEGKARVAFYLDDFANLFRFYRRSRYDLQAATNLLNASILWRMRTDLDLLSLSSLHPLYVTPPSPNPPLFWVNSRFRDFYGRPCGLINLRSIERTAENSLDELKEYIVACMEIMRRFVGDLYRASADDPDRTVLQLTIAIDLQKSGMANLELELLPFLLDLLKNHVPGMVGAVYILNYGWVHAGMWAVIKRVLPQQALAKIFFLSYDELREHFAPARIPKPFGGELDVEIDSSSNDVLRKYGRPRRASVAATPTDSPDATRAHAAHSSISRNNSYDSIYEVFYSADSTPWASRSMTPRHSEPSTPRGDGIHPTGSSSSSGGLKMTPSAARKLRHLQMSRGDLSNAAEHANEPSTRAAGRMRSGSDVRIENGRAVGLSVNIFSSAANSPFVTPAMTPVGPLSPRTSRAPRNPDRHVRFSSSQGRGHSASPPPPLRRVGTASSSFTLYLPNQEDETALPSESEDSDASGKDGEKPPSSTETESSASLLSKLRRLSETSLTPSRPKGSGKEGDEEAVVDDDDDDQEDRGFRQADGTIMYIEPGSPQLQVPHLDEPPLQHVPHAFLSHRTRRAGRDGHVSPYNANNPFFGYPAYIDPPNEGTFKLTYDTTPRHLHVRRRKRDLLRTLTYLFVLRILALHRRLRWRVALVYREVLRTLAIAGHAGSDAGDDFWRNLDARRLSAATQYDPSARAKENRARSDRLARYTKLAVLGLFVLVVRPNWRRRVVTQVYTLLTPAVLFGNGQDGDLEPVDWDDWEQKASKTIARPASRGSGAAAKDHTWTGLHIRKRLGLGAGRVQETSTSTSTRAKAAAGGGGGRGGRGNKYNPVAVAGGLVAAASLGFLLYGDDGASIAGLRELLGALSSIYVVHLIVPGRDNVDVSSSIMDLVARANLADVPAFDSRRILEYTRLEGRYALSRALACDCHLEVALPESNELKTIQELDKIRRSCGLVVFSTLAQHQQAQLVLDALKANPRTPQGKNAPPGMRAFDLAGQTHPWKALSDLMVELRQGWN